MKADKHFPICVGGCGRRGKDVVWYQVADSVRFGECLRCYGARQERTERTDRIERVEGSAAWDPPEDPTGLED